MRCVGLGFGCDAWYGDCFIDLMLVCGLGVCVFVLLLYCCCFLLCLVCGV